MANQRPVESRVRSAVDRWRLTLGDRLVGGTLSAVYAAGDATGRDLVLKLPATQAGDRDATADEAAALTAWRGTGASVRLVDASADALLLVRVRPGLPMPWAGSTTSPGSVAERVEVAAELLERLWSVPADPYPYPSAAEVVRSDDRVAREDAAYEQRSRGEPDRGRPGLERLPATLALAEWLIDTAGKPVLLHGDFLSKNLVSDRSGHLGWVALDPLPLWGEPAFDVATFAAYHPAAVILTVAEALAERLDLDPARVRAWTAVKAVHQSAQAWRDDQDAIDALVGSTALTTLLSGVGG